MPRYEGLDVIRATAMLLGLAYHATYAWLPDVAPWYLVADASPQPWLLLVTGSLHAFRMQLFFALSGFFSHLVFERRGPGPYLRDRSRRLLVPLVVALPLVLALDVALRTWSHSLGLMSPEYAAGTSFRASPVHLWFLIYLWSFCTLAALAPTWSGPSRAVALALRFPPALLLLAVPTCVGLWLHPENKPEAHFWPMPFEALHYGLFFAFGWWLWPARAEASARLRRFGVVALALGLALAGVIFRGGLQWQPLGHVGAGVVAWLVTLGALGFALGGDSTPKQERAPLRFIVESSYWVYLVHYPVVLALQVLFAQVNAPGALEYAATVLGTLGFAWVTFALFVRPTRLGPWLGVKPRVTSA